MVGAHYSGLRRHRLGGGASLKVSDAAIADLCIACHEEFDTYHKLNDLERSEEFLLCIVLTWDRRCKLGMVNVTGVAS